MEKSLGFINLALLLGQVDQCSTRVQYADDSVQVRYATREIQNIYG